MDDPSLWTMGLLALAGLFAGFVDAVVGGGGLVQLPALAVAFPGAAPVQLLAVNKLAGTCGTTVSSLTYYRRVRPDPRTFLPLMAVALLGSAAGAVVASHVPRSAFDPVILVALVVVGAYVLLHSDAGQTTELRFSGRRHAMAVVLAGLVIGFYDGVLGPGTGSFFVFTLVGWLGYNFLEASAKAKMANWATNVAALGVFAAQDAVSWRVGLLVGACQVVGSYAGARTAVSRGSHFVRIFFVVVVAAFVVKIGSDVVEQWWNGDQCLDRADATPASAGSESAPGSRRRSPGMPTGQCPASAEQQECSSEQQGRAAREATRRQVAPRQVGPGVRQPLDGLQRPADVEDRGLATHVTAGGQSASEGKVSPEPVLGLVRLDDQGC